MISRAMMRFVMSVLCCAVVIVSPLSTAAKPARVVSLNLCTDQLVLQLASRDRIASMTYLARDSAISYVAEMTDGLHINHGLMEEIIPLKPDLVLAGSYSTRATTALLKRLGVNVMVFKPASSLADAEQMITDVADALGEPARGRILIERLRASQNAVATSDTTRPRAVVMRPNGFVTGAGSLVDDILNAAGYANLANEMGIGGFGHVGLERIVVSGPDAMIIAPGRGAPTLSEANLRHPVLVRAMAPGKWSPTLIEVPARLWNCAGPQNADAIQLLQHALPTVLKSTRDGS